MDLKTIKLIFFLFLTSFVAADQNLIQKTCKNTLYFKLCVSSLKSDPSSLDADTKGLAAIIVKIGMANATATSSYLSSQLLSAAANDTNAKRVLKECAEKYEYAAEALRASIHDLAAETYDYAYMHISAAADYPNACHNAFNRFPDLAYPPKLARREDSLKHICRLVLGIIDLLGWLKMAYLKAKVKNESHLNIISTIRSKLEENASRMRLFRTTCLGHLIDVETVMPTQLIHYVLLKQVECDSKNKMLFNLFGTICEFNIRNFCLVTGLRIHDSDGQREDSGDRLLVQYCGGKAGIKKNEFLKIYEALGKEADDEDVVKMSLVVMVEFILLGTNFAYKLDVNILSMVDDLPFFNNFAWGKVVYKKTIKYLLQALQETPRSVDIFRKIDEGEQTTPHRYSLLGFPLAFVAWVYEIIPAYGGRFIYRHDVVSPRLLKYQNLGNLLFSHVDRALSDVAAAAVHIKPSLRPSNLERGLCWYNRRPHDPNHAILLSAEDQQEVGITKGDDRVPPIYEVPPPCGR